MTDERPSRPRRRGGNNLRNIRVDGDLWRDAKRQAADMDTSISEVLRQFLAEWVRK